MEFTKMDEQHDERTPLRQRLSSRHSHSESFHPSRHFAEEGAVDYEGEHFKLRIGSHVDQTSIHEDMLGGGEEVPCFPPGESVASIASLACISLGVGIFLLPSVFTSLGLVLGSIAVFFFGGLSLASMLLLYSLAERHQMGSFEDLMVLAFGKCGRAWVPVFVTLTCIIANAAHMQFVVDLVRDISQYFCHGTTGAPIPLFLRALLILGFGLLVMPFCFSPTINSLRYVSSTSVVYVIALCTVCTIFALIGIGSREPGQPRVYNTHNLANWNVHVIFHAAPVIAFAFSSMVNFFPVYREMKDPEKMPKCATISSALCCGMYFIVALVGALAFPNLINASYLDAFPPQNLWVTIGCVGLAILVVLMYPVLNFPISCSIDAIIFPHAIGSLKRRRIYSIVVLLFIVGLDVLVPRIDLVFGLAGSLGLGMVSYTLPSALYLKLCWAPFQVAGEERHPQTNWLALIVAALDLVVGLTLVFGSTVNIILETIKENSS